MKTPEIPDKPVDGYTIEWWQISDYNGAPVHKKAIYFVNTPWKKFAPDSDGYGVPLTDDWMLYVGDRPEGRICGWKNITLRSDDWRNCYATCKDALAAGIRMFKFQVEHDRLQLEEAEDKLHKLEEEMETYKELERMKK